MRYKLKSDTELAKIAGGKDGWWVHFKLSAAAPNLRDRTFCIEPEHIKNKVLGLRDSCGDEFYPAVYFSFKFEELLTEPPEGSNWFIVPLKIFEPVYDYQQEFWAL